MLTSDVDGLQQLRPERRRQHAPNSLHFFGAGKVNCKPKFSNPKYTALKTTQLAETIFTTKPA